MKNVKINNRLYSCPESYDDITMTDYVRMFKGVKEDSDNIEDKIYNDAILVSNIIGAELDEVLNLPANEILSIRDELEFLRYPIKESEEDFVVLDSDIYSIPDFNEMTYRQLIDCELIASEGDDNRENFIKIAAHLLVKSGEKYNNKNVDLIEEKVKKAAVSVIMPYINNFLLKKKLLLKDIQTYSERLEKLRNTLRNIGISEEDIPI